MTGQPATGKVDGVVILTVHTHVTFSGANAPLAAAARAARVLMRASDAITVVVLEPTRGGRLEAAMSGAVARHAARSGAPALRLARAADEIPVGTTGIVFATPALAENLVPRLPTFVVTGADDELPLGGVETLALLHDGAAGVIESSSLVLDEVVEHVLRRAGRGLLVGAPVRGYADLHQAVTVDWPSDGRPELDPICLGAAIALAQVRVLRPVRVGHRGHSWEGLAIALNAKQGLTGYYYAPGTLRRALSKLGKIWAPAEEIVEEDPLREHEGLEGAQRTRLPDLARANGFPSRTPRLRDVAPADVARTLYDTLIELPTPVVEELRGTRFAYVSSPRLIARTRQGGRR